jgi:hypothetical protein
MMSRLLSAVVVVLGLLAAAVSARADRVPAAKELQAQLEKLAAAVTFGPTVTKKDFVCAETKAGAMCVAKLALSTDDSQAARLALLQAAQVVGVALAQGAPIKIAAGTAETPSNNLSQMFPTAEVQAMGQAILDGGKDSEKLKDLVFKFATRSPVSEKPKKK